MYRPTPLARRRRLGGPSLAILLVLAFVGACSTSAAPASSTPAGGGPGAAATGAAAASGTSATEATSAAVAPTTAAMTAATIAAGPKAKTCRDLLSDDEVRQATGLASATLKSADVTVAISTETHCTFDAGSTVVDVGVWSGDRLAAFDTVSSGMANPVTLDIQGATANFYDLSFAATGLARTADHGVSINLTPGDTPIPDMKAATTALLRLVLGRI